ncbi:ovochymase-like [Haematobia irritans]|uniref:ovochymase-like n=1 Tax=Haematobia irritans TaxID=7368 RepID=UPI003F4F5CEA
MYKCGFIRKFFQFIQVFTLICGIIVVKSQDCVDSRLRSGKCVALTKCPDMVEEFYDEVRKTSHSLDFQTFISNSICGFDGRNFLICCRIRSQVPRPPMNQQMSQLFKPVTATSSNSAVPTSTTSPSNVFLFAPLGGYSSINPVTSAPVVTQAPTFGSPIIYPPVNFPSSSNINPFVFQASGQNSQSTPVPTVFQPLPMPEPTPGNGGGIIYQPIPQSTPGTGGVIYQPIPQPWTQLPETTTTTTTISPPSTGSDYTCGVSRANTNRVVGGSETRRGAYPWMAALGYRDEFSPTLLKFLCGGSLISSNYVISSAHCINSNLVLVRLGAHDLSNSADVNAVDYGIRRTKIHEQFDLKMIVHDIALIQLAQMVTMTNFITPICLPESMTFINQDFVGMNPFVAGWGTIKHQGPTSNVLLHAQVPIVSRQTCEQSYQSVFNFVQFSDKIICAGSSIVDACQGDSGGPLMLPQLDGTTYRYYLLGVVSYGYECARAGFPGVYTRVAMYMSWIRQNMIDIKKTIEHCSVEFIKMRGVFLLAIILYSVNISQSQRGFVSSPSYDANFCRTPLGEYGTCVSLKYCPEVLILFERLSTDSAKQYSAELQRLCGNRVTPDQYPVLCCSRIANNIGSNGGHLPNTGPHAATTTMARTPTAKTTTTTTTTETPFTTSLPHRTRNDDSSTVLCLTTESSSGVCKSLKECPVLLNKLQADPNNEEIKSTLRKSHSACGNQSTDVCCPRNMTTTTSSSSRKPRLMNHSGNHLTTEEEGCGLINQTTPKIVGGDESQIGAWPWMALLGYDPYSVRPFKCGGTLISNRHVITAAHCIRRDLSFVRLGEFDLSTESETTHKDINIIKHAKHPDFGKNQRSDLAILLLETVVQFTDLIAPICMPNSIQLRSKSYVKSMPYVAGWGNTEQGGSTSNVLKEAQLPVWENDYCRQIYQRLLPSVPDTEYDDSVICAGYTVGGTDTCQGDSGGPLMIPELYKGLTRYYLIGIISYGHGCGKVPGIYMSTQHWMDWIIEQIETL